MLAWPSLVDVHLVASVSHEHRGQGSHKPASHNRHDRHDVWQQSANNNKGHSAKQILPLHILNAPLFNVMGFILTPKRNWQVHWQVFLLLFLKNINQVKFPRQFQNLPKKQFKSCQRGFFKLNAKLSKFLTQGRTGCLEVFWVLLGLARIFIIWCDIMTFSFQHSSTIVLTNVIWQSHLLWKDLFAIWHNQKEEGKGRRRRKKERKKLKWNFLSDLLLNFSSK